MTIQINDIPLDKNQLKEIAESSNLDLEREIAVIQSLRNFAYTRESDVLRDYYLRGENGVTLEDWKAKVDEIRERYPYPEQPS